MRGDLKANAASTDSLAADSFVVESPVPGSAMVASLVAGSLVAGPTTVGGMSSWPGAIGTGLSSIRVGLAWEILSTSSGICLGIASGCSWLIAQMGSLGVNVTTATAAGSDANCDVMSVIGRS